MTQDAGIMVKEQGAWLMVNVGTKDAPKLLRLKLIPADFEQLNEINSGIVKAGKSQKADGTGADAFGKQVVASLAPFVVDWNLHDEKGKIDVNEANIIRQLGRFMTTFVIDDEPTKDVDPVQTEAKPKAERQSVMTKIIAFIGDYSNFMEA